ncbi:HAUS augmin-like complex subunit 2 isoform X2 [Genypterus blacodes]
MKRQVDKLQLELEMLKVEQRSADVTHSCHLVGKFQVVHMFCNHLQDILKDQSDLRQRLMRPLGCTNLPIRAHLHRFVVDIVKIMLDFIEMLEEKLSSVCSSSMANERVVQLKTSLVLLLAQVAGVESLSKQVLQWKEVHNSLLNSSCAQQPTVTTPHSTLS